MKRSVKRTRGSTFLSAGVYGNGSDFGRYVNDIPPGPVFSPETSAFSHFAMPAFASTVTDATSGLSPRDSRMFAKTA